MTAPNPIEAAIGAGQAELIAEAQAALPNFPVPGNPAGIAVLNWAAEWAIRAAAPILIAHGRELAAEAIEDAWQRGYDTGREEADREHW
jgi:hypothetical protein